MATKPILLPNRRPTVTVTVEVRLRETQLEVIRMAVQGNGLKQMAAELYISLSAVKHRLSGLYALIGVRNKTELAIWAIKKGIE